MIEVRDLTKRFGKRAAADGLSFTVRNGRRYGLLGPAGSGKSVVMDLIAGRLLPDSGTVRLNGYDTAAQPRQARRQAGYLSDPAPLFLDMTPVESLRFLFAARGVPSERADREIGEILLFTELEPVKRRLIRRLSEPLRRRVGLAQALVGDPDILLLDNPGGGLSPKDREALFDLIDRLDPERTVVAAGRTPEDIPAFCDALLILDGGRLVAETDAAGAAELFGTPIGTDAEEGIGTDAAGADELLGAPIETDSEEGIGTGAAAAVGADQKETAWMNPKETIEISPEEPVEISPEESVGTGAGGGEAAE